MKITRVTYITKAEYSAQNQQNIQAVMNELQKLNNPNIFYFTTLAEDGKTFTHTAFAKTEEDNKILTNLPAFKHFVDALKASSPEMPPKTDHPALVGASRMII